jgi:hypothetical protein
MANHASRSQKLWVTRFEVSRAKARTKAEFAVKLIYRGCDRL